MNWRAEYRMFRCERQDRDDALDEATTFAGQLKPKELIGISHVVDKQRNHRPENHWNEQPASRSSIVR